MLDVQARCHSRSSSRPTCPGLRSCCHGHRGQPERARRRADGAAHLPDAKGATLYIQEWVPVNPDKEILAASRPVQTKWGQGWLLRQGEELIAIWIDIGPLRASIYTTDQTLLPKEQLLAMAETMGPASNRQVFSFVLKPPQDSKWSRRRRPFEVP